VTGTPRHCSTFLLALLLAAAAAPGRAVAVFGNSQWSGLPTYLGRVEGKGAYVTRVVSGPQGQWTVDVERYGSYAVAIEDAYGFGPALRPGVVIGGQDPTRVNIHLPFLCDLVNAGAPTPEEHREYGQLFRAPGTSVAGIACKDAKGLMVSMFRCTNLGKPGGSPRYEGGELGEQVGATLPVSVFYAHGALPTVPGAGYYLKFTRSDGAPFRMALADDRYADGEAYLDGEKQPNSDLGIRIQYDPSGQILRHKPGFSQVYQSAKRSYGQSFTAKGTSLAMLDVFVAHGDQPYVEPTVRILEGGPRGKQIGPDIRSHVVVLNPGELPLTPGGEYYIEVSSGPTPGDLRMYAEKDVFESGQLHLDGRPVAGHDLAMILVEYEPDEAAPPPATMLQQCPADGKLKAVWDVPLSNDISKVILRRIALPRPDEQAEGELIAEFAVTAQGRSYYLDSGLKNGVTYLYSAHTVDVAGNESIAAEGTGTPCAGLPMKVEIINGDFEGPTDFVVPFGWALKRLAGEFPEPRIDNLGEGPDPGNTAGWTIDSMSDSVLYQRVPCEKGRRYQFAADSWRRDAWHNPNYNISTLVGIDPLGGDDPLAKSVVWSQPVYTWGNWASQSASATARLDRVTVYLRAYGQYNAPRDIEARFDNAELSDVTQAP
jgi:hypothetical protein